MCLEINDYVKLNFDSEGWVTCYKVYTLYEDGLESLYKYSPVTVFPVVSDRITPRLSCYEKKLKQVEKGIHVFKHLVDAELNILATPEYEDVVLSVRCHKDDLVAVGYFDEQESAVFHKIYL